MFDKFKQLGDLKKMRDQAMEMQKALAQEKIEVEEQEIKIVMTGDQRVETLEINGEEQNSLKDVFNKAIKKSQEVAARKLQEMSGGLGGLLGQ
jgi:DNA-binding protein YbaB